MNDYPTFIITIRDFPNFAQNDTRVSSLTQHGPFCSCRLPFSRKNEFDAIPPLRKICDFLAFSRQTNANSSFVETDRQPSRFAEVEKTAFRINPSFAHFLPSFAQNTTHFAYRDAHFPFLCAQNDIPFSRTGILSSHSLAQNSAGGVVEGTALRFSLLLVLYLFADVFFFFLFPIS